MAVQRPVTGVVRVACRGTASGQGVVNVFHVRASNTGVTQATVDAIAGGIKTAYESNFAARLQGLWSGDTVTAVDLSSNIGNSSVLALAGTPGPASPTTPLSLACCITWKIPRHYRGGHPRTYIGPIASSFMETGNSWTSAFMVTMNTAAQAFLTAVNTIPGDGQTCELVSVHRVVEGVTIPTPIVVPIEGRAVDSRIDTQRRRLGRDR
jgi:hypothetical protein